MSNCQCLYFKTTRTDISMYSWMHKRKCEIRCGFSVAVVLNTKQIFRCGGFKDFVEAKRLSETLRDSLEFFGKKSWTGCIDMDVFALRNLELKIHAEKLKRIKLNKLKNCPHEPLDIECQKLNFQFYLDFMRKYVVNSHAKFCFLINSLAHFLSNGQDRCLLENVHAEVCRVFKFSRTAYVLEFNKMFGLSNVNNVDAVDYWFKYVQWLAVEFVHNSNILTVKDSDSLASQESWSSIRVNTSCGTNTSTSVEFSSLRTFAMKFLTDKELHLWRLADEKLFFVD